MEYEVTITVEPVVVPVKAESQKEASLKGVETYRLFYGYDHDIKKLKTEKKET